MVFTEKFFRLISWPKAVAPTRHLRPIKSAVCPGGEKAKRRERRIPVPAPASLESAELPGS